MDNEEDELGNKKKKKKKTGGFQSMGLSYPVYKAIQKCGYNVPTPIQRRAIPVVLEGQDVVAMARTGSGKTAAFLIPTLEKLKSHSTTVGARAVILSPTRELALQTGKFCKDLGRFTDLRFAVVVGGDDMESQFDRLAQNPDIIIATPGRLAHHLSETEMTLKQVEIVVFDEADRLFEMGFAEQIREIMGKMSDKRQTLLFSATMPKLLVEFTRAGLRNPQLIRLDVEQKLSENLRCQFFTIRAEEKIAALIYLVRELVEPSQSTIIFAATRHHVEFLHTLLSRLHIDSSLIYGNMDQTARKINLGKFRAGKTKFMIVTDVAARGIDIPLLDNVINYDFPAKAKLFVHRAGRAARAGRQGTAFSLVCSNEIPYMIELHLFLGQKLQNVPKTGVFDPNQVYYGRFPQGVLDTSSEDVRIAVSNDGELQNLSRVMTNAYELYFKTRPVASRESIKRMKELPPIELHPLLMTKADKGALEHASFVEQLKSFRPKTNILEMEQGRNVQAMKEKRKAHSFLVAASNQRREAEKSLIEKMKSVYNATAETEEASTKVDLGADAQVELFGENLALTGARKRKPGETVGKRKENSSSSNGVSISTPDLDTNETNNRFSLGGIQPTKKRRVGRDDSNFISNTPTGASISEKGLAVSDRGSTGRLDDMVLDLMADEHEGLNKNKRAMRWDQKKRKYVMTEIGADGRPLTKKNESGKRIKDNKKQDIYANWMKRSKRRIQRDGEQEDEDNMRRSKDALSHGKHRLSTANANSDAKDELRSEDQIKKNRKEKEHKVARMQKKTLVDETKKWEKSNQHRIMAKGAPNRSKAIVRKSGGGKRR
eukprot:GILK01010329.1.p1 GENE.GILK01010329.1~~GILK01010329.1.p1  ORF type:complete len:908 (-),score=253.28 GILK01010329.1:152-2638(-)